MFAVDLTDSIGKVLRLPALHFLVRPTTLHCFVYFQVNNGIWCFLDYVEDRSLLVALSAFLQIFDPNILPLLLYVLHSSCFYILML